MSRKKQNLHFPRCESIGGKALSREAAKAESVAEANPAIARKDHRDEQVERKLRPLDRRAGRPVSERRSGSATSGKERACKRCGCTQYNACEDLRLMDSCCWVSKDLCSACLTDKEFWEWVRGTVGEYPLD